MATEFDLEMAVLSMDAYNHQDDKSYAQGIVNPDGHSLGGGLGRIDG